MKPTDRPRTEKGVTYCGSEFEAQLAAASMHPSRRGNKSLLSDVLEDLHGNVFEPRPQAGAYAPRHLAGEGDEQEHMDPAITWGDASVAANQAATSRLSAPARRGATCSRSRTDRRRRQFAGRRGFKLL